MVTKVKFQDIEVTGPGFGAMSFSGGYGAANDDESLQVLAKAVELGCTFWDTALVYGMGHNESLIGRFLKENPGVRDKLFIGSKCGFSAPGVVTNKPEHIYEAIEASTKRLGTAPDLYYLHRIDPNTPLEDSIPALQSLKESGKCKYIGLSEPSAETLRKACKIAHIDAIQIEYSPWYVEHETNDLIAAARDNGVTIVAYSPLGKGVLTGAFTDKSQFASDIRGTAPRFTEHWDHNKVLVDEFQKLAGKKGCSPGQLAIAWVMAQGAIPIPGTKNAGRLEENFGGTNVQLSQDELHEIRQVIDSVGTKGDRYNKENMAKVGR